LNGSGVSLPKRELLRSQFCICEDKLNCGIRPLFCEENCQGM
jgi:hypothetical protein